MDYNDTLNDNQKKAVLTVDGPLLILAGAGSGKTRVITNRIAHLINNKNIQPYNIFAVTLSIAFCISAWLSYFFTVPVAVPLQANCLLPSSNISTNKVVSS